MENKPHLDVPTGDAHKPQAAQPAAELRAHLADLLHSPHFKNSKRCQALLACVVEQALEGNSDLLKERTLGVMAFGRNPAYDTNQDAIVRNVATEVRKRLAQFYVESGHQSGIRIELPPGSYVPEFRVGPVAPLTGESRRAGPRGRLWRSQAIAASVILVVAAAIAVGIGTSRTGAFDRFWAPILNGKATVQLCLGQPTLIYAFQGQRKVDLDRAFDPASGQKPTGPISASELSPVGTRYLWRRDAFCMASLSGFLASRGVPFRLRSESDATYAELRGNPLIMIGAFDRRRQIRSTAWRYGFGQTRIDGVDYKYVRDRQHPEDYRWKFPWAYTTQEATEYDDYGIITRELTSNSEKAVMSVIGATDYSTLASGQFLVNRAYLERAMREAPEGWDRKNVQVVIRTRIIQGVPGPTSAVAVHTW